MRTRLLHSQPGGQPVAPSPCQMAQEARAWRSLALAGACIGTDAGLTFSSRDLGAILTFTEVAVPAAIALTLLIAILSGSDATCERAFRLLRWLVDRPEPLARATAGGGSRQEHVPQHRQIPRESERAGESAAGR